MKRWVMVLLLLCGTLAWADDLADAAIQRLSTVSMYAFGGVGFVGRITQGELDFRIVVAQPREVAEAAFEKLYASGNPQAEAYALAGMKKMNPARFKELVMLAEGSTQEVRTGRGCIISREPLRQIAQGLDRDGSGR